MKSITKKFIKNMDQKDKKFLEQISQSVDRKINTNDFEENFATLEIALDSVTKYCDFLESDVGKEFLNKYSLKNPELNKHKDAMERIYYSYLIFILNIIQEKKLLETIKNKIPKFVNFFVDKISKAEKAYVFTLNYDLLTETILIDKLGKNKFTDFCISFARPEDKKINKFNFDPDKNKSTFKESQKIELHHLHGSLSLFYDHEKNEIYKLRSKDIMLEEIYNKIRDDNFKIIPAVITGGIKSNKINQFPFKYYYNKLKKICDTGDASELYVIGYSFRDEHINDLIDRWTKNVVSYKDGLRIIDYQTEDSKKTEFIKNVRSIIRRRIKIPDECFEFGGVDNISSCSGTSPKKFKKVESQ